MRLAAFISANVEPILQEWEQFARSIWPKNGESADPAEVRNDAEAVLRATVYDMESAPHAPGENSRGGGAGSSQAAGLARASSSHGAARAASGLELVALMAEYRALRASVVRLWRASEPSPDVLDVADLTRFNESLDQSLTEAVHGFGQQVERDRQYRLTSEQAARVEAEAASRSKDVFLATLSHEMRSPLNVIVGWLSLLRNDDTVPPKAQEGLKVIERNTRAQVQLIDDILDVSRIASGKLRVDVRPCELVDVINEGVEVVRPAAEARGITLNVRLDPSASRTAGDSGRLQQVVWNLVSNAVKFTPKGGHVDVSLRHQQSSVEIEVTDTGQGISTDFLPRIFDPFRQADSSTRRKHSGLGLGLSIVKYIVEAHGGTVEANSPGEGQGATFKVQLPVRAVQMAEADAEAAGGNTDHEIAETAPDRPLVRLDGVRVLVVDDEADARQVLVMVLQQAGAVAKAAGGLDEAIQAIAETRPEVLVSDLGMPGHDGFDLIRQVRALGYDAAQLPAVALTAFVQTGDADLALSAGYQVHVSKPVDPHDLTSVIADLTGRTG